MAVGCRLWSWAGRLASGAAKCCPAARVMCCRGSGLLGADVATRRSSHCVRPGVCPRFRPWWALADGFPPGAKGRRASCWCPLGAGLVGRVETSGKVSRPILGCPVVPGPTGVGGYWGLLEAEVVPGGMARGAGGANTPILAPPGESRQPTGTARVVDRWAGAGHLAARGGLG